MMKPPYTEVRFTLPYSLPFDGEFDFDWAGDSFSVKVDNVQVFDVRSKKVTGFEIQTSGTGSVKVYGPHGLSHLARVTTQFRASLELEDRQDLPLRVPDSDECREHACEAVNRLIETYREATGDFRVRRVMPQHDVLSLKVELVDEEGGGTTGWALGSKRRLTYPLSIRGFEEAKPMMEVLLRDQVRILVVKDYLHAARRFFEEREFALAVVLSNAVLELFWANLLRVGLETEGTPGEEARKKLRRWTTPTANKSTLTVLDEGLQQLWNRSVKNELPLLWGILYKARDLRKNVVHPWPKRPKAGETLRAMGAIEFAITWLVQAALDATSPGS